MQLALHRYRSQLTLLGCGLLVVLCPLLVVLRDVQTHNRQLDLIANSIYDAPLPANTTVLHRNAYVANVGGSGHACDYVAEQTMQTALTRVDLLAYYQVTQGPSAEPIGPGIALSESAQYYRTESIRG